MWLTWVWSHSFWCATWVTKTKTKIKTADEKNTDVKAAYVITLKFTRSDFDAHKNNLQWLTTASWIEELPATSELTVTPAPSLCRSSTAAINSNHISISQLSSTAIWYQNLQSWQSVVNRTPQCSNITSELVTKRTKEQETVAFQIYVKTSLEAPEINTDRLRPWVRLGWVKVGKCSPHFTAVWIRKRSQS